GRRCHAPRRLWHRGGGGEGDEGRCLRLPHQAVPARAAPEAHQQGPGAPRPDRAEPCAPAAARRPAPAGRGHRLQPRLPPNHGARRAGRRQLRHGAHPGRERLGGTKTFRVDVRIVAATNQDLAQMVREKRFREDLYYRLNVITLTVPPLRERREDVRVLAQHFLRVYAAKNNRRLEGFTDEAIRRLEAYAWPGNVRELENVIERGVVLAQGALMDVTDLPPEIAGSTPLPEGVLLIRL